MAALQRPYRGSRVSSFYPVKSLPPLSALDSAFQLQEYISLLIRLDVHDVDAIVALPGKAAPKDQDESADTPEPDIKNDADRKSDISVDRACWIYEQLRRLAQDLSHPLITMLQQECTRSSCPQMKAGEWLYLCVAHGNDGAMEQCCAIDYILHTVDSATALLNSPRAFPSRLSIPQTSHRHFSSLARRLGRIFAHAYFHHREAFEQAEAESSLYARFLKLTNQFDLVPPEFLVIPESAIHPDDKSHAEQVEPPRLFSVAVHPAPIPQNDVLTTDSLAEVDHFSATRLTGVDAVNQLGTGSPRRLGRSRTDTMVFTEGYTVAEELSKSDDVGQSTIDSLLNVSPVDQVYPHIELETRAEDLDDEDIGDAHSDSTLAGPLSPPVEALSLISLVDTSDEATSHESVLGDEPSEPLSTSDAPAILSGTEQETVVVPTPEEHQSTLEPSALDSVPEGPPSAASGFLIKSTEDLPPLEENVTESVDEGLSISTHSEPLHTEPHEVSEHPEPVLELNEPPPSEPIPPESESDITDEAGLDGDEVDEGREEEGAVIGE